MSEEVNTPHIAYDINQRIRVREILDTWKWELHFVGFELGAWNYVMEPVSVDNEWKEDRQRMTEYGCQKKIIKQRRNKNKKEIERSKDGKNEKNRERENEGYISRKEIMNEIEQERCS
jgi:hypothetical protein